MPVNVQTKEVSLRKIKRNPDNPRKISQADMERLRKSLRDFPEMLQLREIIVDEDMMILGGNMRYLALKEEGETRAIAKIVTGLTPEQKKEFIVKDNANFGVWDTDALANLWSDLPLVDWGVKIPEDWLNPSQAPQPDEPAEAGSGPARKEVVPLDSLRGHPRNYRSYHDDQLEHIVAIISATGVHPDIIVSADGTILRGHAVCEAARRMNTQKVTVTRLECRPNDLTALKILITDNEFGHLMSVDDRALAALLKEMLDADPENGLLGTGYNAQMLAALIYVTRPSSEVADIDEAAEWVGMPDFVEPEAMLRIQIACRNEEDRNRLTAILATDPISIQPMRKVGRTWSFWYPQIERDDLMALRYDQERAHAEDAAQVSDLRSEQGTREDQHDSEIHGG